MISNIIRSFNRKEDKEDIVKPYLTFKSSTPMTITPNYTNTGITLQYSLDAKTWTNISAKGVTPSRNVIYFRGSATNNKRLFTPSSSTDNAWIFTGATNLEAHGDITMLLQDTLGGMVRDIPLSSYAFAYMFYGCTSLTTAPRLPATTLAINCYISTFYGCTSLTTVPALPATNLVGACYKYMFRNCTKIKLSTTKIGSYQTAYRLPTAGTGVVLSDSLLSMFFNTGGTFTGTPTINTTYYTENTIV